MYAKPSKLCVRLACERRLIFLNAQFSSSTTTPRAATIVLLALGITVISGSLRHRFVQRLPHGNY